MKVLRNQLWQNRKTGKIRRASLTIQQAAQHDFVPYEESNVEQIVENKPEPKAEVDQNPEPKEESEPKPKAKTTRKRATRKKATTDKNKTNND